MQSIIIIHLLIAVCLIGLMLLQHGKGADTGAAFGSSASSAMFGSAGATSFLMKMTIVLAASFFATSIGLSYLASRHPVEEVRASPLQETAPFKNLHVRMSRSCSLISPKWWNW